MDRTLALERMHAAPVLRRLPLGELDRLVSRSEWVRFAPGEQLLEGSSEGRHLFILLEGRVSIRIPLRDGGRDGEDEHRVLAVRRAGDWIGEMALVDGGPRSARAVAETPVSALRIAGDAFLEAAGAGPAVLDLMRTLTARLRESDAARIEALREKHAALSGSVRRLSAENRRLRNVLGGPTAIDGFRGPSAAAERVRAAARLAAASELPVLLVGETGTGKEVLARAIHAEGSRSERGFVALNCALLGGALLESQLFGHARGAFTGASETRTGLVEAASGGTLFLDELTDMPLATQASLLRFLEQGEFRRVGETRLRRGDVRLVAAFQEDPERAVREGRLRPDLRYRLDVIRIELPPLRERRDDIAAIASELARSVAERLGVAPLELAPGALEALRAAPLAGNVRELRNEIERLYAWRAGSAGSPVPEAALSDRIRRARSVPGSYGDTVRAFKRTLVRDALEESGGNVTRAARRLGLHRSNLSRMIRDLGVETGGTG